MSINAGYQRSLAMWSDIQGHLPRLCEAARGTVIEIGTRGGFSTSALLAGVEAHGGHVYSIDIHDCGAVFAGHPQWTFTQADSQKVTPDSELVRDCDVLFVDGDHSYEGCLSDLRIFGPKAKVIFVHDTDAPDYPGVRQAVDGYTQESGRSVTYHPGSFGMAEIR